MSNFPTGEMTWRPEGISDCILHLRYGSAEPWKFYRDFPEYALPDPLDFSKGCATLIELLKKGWKVV